MKSTLAKSIGLVVVLSLCISDVEGRGVDLGVCDEKRFECRCGSPGYSIYIPVKQCTYFYRWKNYCKPCNDVKEEEVCDKFKSCAQCDESNTSRCKSCPPGKYGDWCVLDCKCKNGGECNREDGRCRCPPNYEGVNCEISKGCPMPSSNPGVIEVRKPPIHTKLIEYSCTEGYQLIGASRITCLPNYQWSDAPPRCERICEAPPTPDGGNVDVNIPVVVGTIARYSCKDSNVLIGEGATTCQPDGTWSSEAPVCIKVSFCDDPGTIKNSRRSIEFPFTSIVGRFPEGTLVRFNCEGDLLLMGDDILECRKDGTWSAPMPECIKVAETTVTCGTTGAELMNENVEKLRIHCPPGCATNNAPVWGTAIYHETSSVCRAAIHTAKITNSGGPVYLVNNGIYSDFLGSDLNGVKSNIFPASGRSFRFQNVQNHDLKGNENSGNACPPGWFSTGDLCVYLAEKSKAWHAARSTCKNLGGDLTDVTDDKAKDTVLEALLKKGLNRVWSAATKTLMTNNNTTDDDLSDQGEGHSIFAGEDSNFTAIEDDLPFQGDPRTASGATCYAANVLDRSSLAALPLECSTALPYICAVALHTVKCKTPEPIQFGYTVSKDERPDGFHVGSSVTYKCEPLHYLSGTTVSVCTANGTWSSKPPRCIKVTTCQEPPLPPYGKRVILPSNQNGPGLAARRQALPGGLRRSHLPPGIRPLSALSLSVQSQNETDKTNADAMMDIPLPKGHYRVGTRMGYSCISRYYTLTGSSIRRCMSKGTWSGHLPSCIPECGRSESPRTPFLTNGNASEVGQWPWQVGIALYFQQTEQWFLTCGGALVNERWVITAAHCVTYQGTLTPFDIDTIRIYTGKYHRSEDKDDDEVKQWKVQELHLHPDYHPYLFDGDIALIQLTDSVEFTSRVQPVCLPNDLTTRNNLKRGNKGVVTGWGQVEDNGEYADTLQQAVLPLIPHDICEANYSDSGITVTISETMFCAGQPSGEVDTCSGDSGGPMVFATKDGQGLKWTLEGIVSWGSPIGCGRPSEPAVFTKVHSFLQWIREFI